MSTQYDEMTPPQPTYMTKSPQQVEADKASQMSLIFGILSVVLLGIVFGPLAIWQASKAERLGAAATAGKVLGWVGTVLGALGLLWLVFVIVMFMSAAASSAGILLI